MPRDRLLLGALRLLSLPGLLVRLCLLLSRPLLLSLLSPLLLRLLGTLSPLRLLSLLGPLRLLSGLCARLLLGACLRLLRLHVRALLLCGWLRTLLLPALLLLGLALFFVLLVLLRVRRDNRPEKQKQADGTGSSNELQGNLPPLRSLLDVHADSQFALTMFHRLCRLRLGLGLVDRPIRVVGRRVERTYTALTAPSSTY